MSGYLRKSTIVFLLGFGLLGAGFLLGGCADMRSWRDSTLFARPVFTEDTASPVLRDCRQIVKVPVAEQRLEVKQLKSAYDKLGGERERFLLVCLGLHPESHFRDQGMALRLLQDYRKRAEPREDLIALAELLEALILQQQQLERGLKAERERSETLADKLKALENIEKIIQERERKALPTP